MIKQAHTKKPDHLNGIQILSASYFTSSILVLPELRAPYENDNANKVSTLLNTPWRPEGLIPPNLEDISPIWLSPLTQALADLPPAPSPHLPHNQIVLLPK